MPDGTPGELVFTTLTKTGMPLLRYRSGDVASLAGPMLVVRGVNVYPTELAESGADLARDLTGALRERLGLTCSLLVVSAGSLPRVEVGKAQRLVRWSSGPAPVPELAT